MDIASFHLVDNKAEFVPGLDKFLGDNDFLKYGKNYNIVSIIGGQSSGKSTLLNALFATSFETLNSAVIRQQTTKGIFISRMPEKPLLVMDVEGSDSKERWEDRHIYEQSTALFGLALSQVLIVNIWTQEVGRYTASQYEIIRVIFEMNIKLFRNDTVKQIVFVLRDFADDDNFAAITGTIGKDITNIWNEIVKPEELANTSPDKVFKISFFKIAHLKYAKTKFDNDVNELRKAFCEDSHPQYLFKNFNYNQNLPVDGISRFGSEIWDVIKNNKDLNLPSQKILVSNIRCTEIKKEIFDSNISKFDEIKKIVKKGFYSELKVQYQVILQSSFSTFEKQAHDYVQEVYLEKKAELESDFFMEIRTVFAEQLKHIKKILSDKFSIFNETLKRSNDMKIAAKAMSEKMEELSNEAQMMLEASIVDSSRFNEREIFSEIEDDLNNQRHHAIQLLLTNYLQSIESRIKKQIEKVAYSLFNDLNDEFWVELNDSYMKHIAEVESEVKATLKGFSCIIQRVSTTRQKRLVPKSIPSK